MILFVLFCGLFSNTVAAGTSITNINHLSRIALTTSFTTNPPAVSGTITICQGQSITYTDTSTGIGTNPIYAWSFGGGNISSFASASPPAIIYNTSGTFSTTLTVNGIMSSVTVVVNSANPSNPIITVSPNVGWEATNFNSTNYFNYCADGSTGGLFMFSTNSTNTNANTQHSIDWGDGSPITTSTTANITDEFHSYTTNGIFQITYTVILQSGCSYTNTYNVFIGANPTASIINNGVPLLCNPGRVQYSIIPGAQNTFGTIYTFQVNDTNPSQTQTFTHAQVITPGFLVTHNFATISCNTSSNINGTVYPNSFQASITVSNPCGSSSSAIGPINIQSKPVADFSANPSNSQICLNTSVVFTDTTTPGTNIGSSPTFTCTQTYKRYWQIIGPSGLLTVGSSGNLIANSFVSVVGNLGFNANFPNSPSVWSGSSTNTLNITFNTPGTYSITIFTSGSNSCGITSQTKTICVNPEVIANFTMSPTTGCSPTMVTLDNLSSLPGCTNNNIYAWQVTPSNPLNCPNVTSPGWSFTSGNASSFEPEITFTSAGIYTVQLTTSLQSAVAGPLCQPNIKTQTITIKDKPRATLTPQIICEGTPITLNPTVFNCYATQAVTYSWDFLSNPAVTISNVNASNPTITFTSPGTYNYTLTLTNECGSNTFSSSLVVNPAVQITASGPTATCINTGIPLIGSITGGATTGTWTASISGGTFAPSATALSPTYTPPTNFTGIITFTLTSAVPTGPCTAKTISFPIVINGQATSEAGSYNPVCLNGSLQLNGIVGGAASSGSWTSSNGGTFSNVNSLTSNYTPPAGFTGTIVLTLTTNDPPGPCNPESDNVTITVIPMPTINTISNVVVCHNESVGPISFSGTSATNYSWTNSNPAIGLVAAGTNAISFTGTNTGTSPITGTITVTPFNTSGATSCAGTSTTFTITINPRVQVNTIPGQIVCNGDTVTIPNFSTTNTGGTTSYAWTSSNAAVGLSTSGNGDILSFTAANITTAPINTTITITPTFSNGGVSCTGPTKSILITVNPTAQVNQPANFVFCAGTPITAIPFSSTNTIGTTTYSWTNDTLGIGLGATGTGNIPVFTPINNTTSPIIATITVTPTFANGGTNCTGPSKTFTITINPKGQVNNVSNIIVCNGDSVPLLTFTTNNTGGTTFFNWSNNTSSIGLAGSGSNTIPYFTAVNNGTTPIIATITVTPTFANGTPTCSGTPQQFTITVNPSPAVIFTPTNQSICSGDSSALVTLDSSMSGVTYSWTSVQPADITGVATLGTTTIPVQTLTNASSAPITITYNATATIAGGATCTGASYAYTITVKSRPAITEVFTTNTCSGSGFSVTPLASTLNSIPTGTTYSWPAPLVIGGLTGGAPGTGQLSITGILVNPTNTSQTAIYTVTPIVNGCTGTAFTVTVTVNPKPVISAVTPAAICSGTFFSVTPTNSGTTIVPSGTTFTWTVGVNPNITDQSASTATGITTISQTLTNGVNTPQSLIYTVTPTSGSTGNCVGTPFNITVTVNPKPTIADITNAAICSGAPFSITPSNNSTTIVPIGSTYTWTVPVSTPLGAITGGSAQPTGQNNISQLLNNTTTSPGTLDYTVTPTSGSCQGTPFHIIVTVNPIPGTLTLTNLSYCNGVLTTPIGFSNIVTGTTYTWTNSNPLIGLTPTSGVGNIPAFTAINGGATAIISTISVIASANSCSRTAETFTITVNPSPSVTFTPTNQSICSGDSSALVTLGSTTAGATYSWTAVQPADITGVTTLGTTTIPVQTLTNVSSAPITITYNATATIAGGATCAGASYAYTITVKPRPAIQNQSIVICNNQSFTFNPISGSPTSSTVVPVGTIFTWTIIPNPNITGASTGTGSSINQTLINSSNSVQLIDYNVVPTYLNCPGNPFSVRITVNPTPTVEFSSSNQIICNNSQSLPVTLNTNATGIINYSWISNNPSGITGIISTGTNSIPSQTLINNSNNPITINYTAYAVIAGSLNCQGPPSNYTITVNPTILTSSVLSNYNSYNVSFFGGSDGAIDLTVAGGSGVYNYNWTGPNSFVSSSQDISNLVAGNYNVIINDGYCTPVILNFTLTQPPELLIQENLVEHLNLFCFGDNNGQIGVTITQGTLAPYTYELLNSSGIVNTIQSTNLLNVVFNGLIAGNYSIRVNDSNNGVKTISGIVITQPNDIIITAITTPITCYGDNNASITLNVTGGTSPYTGSWNNLATGLYQNNLSAGTYTILVKDANNCPKSITIIIPEVPIFTVNPVVTNVSCFGANDGSINLNFLGGISPIVLNWSDGSTAGTTRNNLGPGTYSVTIRDSKPCYINRTFIIVEPQMLVLSSNITNALDCNNANSGSINLMVSGGNPPFTYLWSNGATTEDLTNVVAGNYSVTVRDSKGCTISVQYVISRPPPIALNVQTNTVVNCDTRIISQSFVGQASGGVPPYTYNWSSGIVSGINNQIMNTSTNGMVILQATDAVGCRINYTFDVNIPTLGNISFNSTSYAYSTYGNYSINDPIQFTNIATGDFISVNWSFGDGTYSTDLNPIHQYVSVGTYIITQTATYPFGCVYNNVTSIIIGEGYTLIMPNAFTPNNDALNAYLQPKYKGLTDFVLDVYNTWGELIYSEKGDAIKGWDGKVKGIDSENGNYYYKISGKTFYGTIIQKEGSFVLIK